MTIWWCEVHNAQGCGGCCWTVCPVMPVNPAAMVERRLVSPDALVVERQDGEWPEWIRTALIMYLYDDGGLRVDLEYVLDALLVVQENQK